MDLIASIKSTLERIMAAKKPPTIPLPKSWTKHVRAAMLHMISLAQYATAYTRSWAADSTNGRLWIKAENDRSQQELLLLREEMRIKDARMAQISPHRRPYYPPTKRMAILELRAGARLVATANGGRIPGDGCHHRLLDKAS